MLVEDVSDLGIDVVVEKLIDKFDDLGRRLHLLRGRPGVHLRKRLGFATLETNVNLRNPF